jgi:hypothetical protein
MMEEALVLRDGMVGMIEAVGDAQALGAAPVQPVLSAPTTTLSAHDTAPSV